MNKLFYFFMICLYLLGTIGGIGNAVYNKSYLIAVGVAAVGYMAFGKVKGYFDNLIK